MDIFMQYMCVYIYVHTHRYVCKEKCIDENISYVTLM